MSASENRLTALTRRKLFEVARDLYPPGDIEDELRFLGQVWDLATIPSHDSRFPTFKGDFLQHRSNNLDWDDDWIFEDERFELRDGPDIVLLRFMAALIHPETIIDRVIQREWVDEMNDALRPDGFELLEVDRISGHPVFEARPVGGYQREASARISANFGMLGDPAVLQDHFEVIEPAIRNNPALAISSSKELVESLCKTVLERSNIPYSNGETLPGLYRKVADLLKLQAESVPDSSQASGAAQGTLRTLVTTVQNLAELRNAMGRGHGRVALSPAYERHARLAFNAAITVSEFLLETWNERVSSGKLSLP